MDRRKRAKEPRRLAREHPDAPAETFFTADELECLARQGRLLGRQFRPPATIMDALVIAGAMMGRATRRGELVYLPSLDTLEKIFEKLEILVDALQYCRRQEAERAREEERRARGGTA